MEENKTLDPKAAAEAEVDALVKKGLKALDEFASFNQDQIDYIVAKMSVAGLDHHGTLARMAIEETHRGVFEDKATKNLYACEYVVNNMRHLKTVGIISSNPVTGITQIAEPVGVVCGITPVTNPTSTVIFKCLICMKTRNPIIFSFHPGAHESSKAAAIVMRDAAVAAGAAWTVSLLGLSDLATIALQAVVMALAYLGIAALLKVEELSYLLGTARELRMGR